MTRGYTLSSRFSTDLVKHGGQYYQIGRVKSIILSPSDEGYNNPSDIGKISYSILYSPLNTSLSGAVNKPAYPMWGFVKQYPLVNEIVLIFTGPTPGLNDNSQNQQSFYFPPYNLWNDTEQNAFPDLSEFAAFRNQLVQIEGYATEATPRAEFPLGKTFRLKQVDNIRTIKPFEGDTVIQGRFGQSVRFGSTNVAQGTVNSKNNVPNLNNWSNNNEVDKNGDPITIILNQQGERAESEKFDTLVEDIERDGSSIYMTSTQTLDFSFTSKFPLGSLKTTQEIVIPQTLDITKSTGTSVTSATNQDRR